LFEGLYVTGGKVEPFRFASAFTIEAIMPVLLDSNGIISFDLVD
jgi:hypothetical protein